VDTPQLPAVTVSRRGEDRLLGGHVWVYASDVEDAGRAAPGDAVRVVNRRGHTLGTAHYSSSSQIRLRLLDRGVRAADRAFFAERLRAAQSLRDEVVRESDACRLVHAEGDRLPGLIVDRYGDCLAAQFLDQGMDRASETIADVLEEMFAPRAIVARNDAGSRRLEGLPQEVRVLRGALDAPVEVRFNGLAWGVDLLGGQKTGIYLDQRENYEAARRHARGRALDAFTSTGGFALHLASRCEQVEGVDSSAAALATAEANRQRNGLANVRFREADVFDLLTGYLAGRRAFETIVLDPPAFAKSRANVDAALRGYREINTKALRLLAAGGILVTCSCSHHVSEADLLEVVAQAALDAGRTLRVRERRAQAADHPVLLTVPETLYLKCLILEAL
jgi:23S rRNA (cytosine1962-C5)-methyltransferase